MKFKIFLLIGIVCITGIVVVFAGCPYDLIDTIELDAHVNILDDKQSEFSYAIYLDEACTKELIGSMDFGSIRKGESSNIFNVYIKNTGIKKWAIGDIRTNSPDIKITWGSIESTTILSGEKLHVWIKLQIDPDIKPSSQDFNLLIDIVDLSAHYRSRPSYDNA